MKNSRGFLSEALKARRDVDGLIKIVNDTENPARMEAALELGVIRDPRAVTPLINALRATKLHLEYDISEDARNALIQIGSAAVGPLITTLKHKDLDVRRNAAEALGEIKDARAVQPLINQLQDLGWNAARALVQLGQASVEPLIGALRDKDAKVREDAAWALGEIGDARAVKPLIGALKDSAVEVRRKATEALGQTKDARAIEPLEQPRKKQRDQGWGPLRHLAQFGRAAVELLNGVLKGKDTRAGNTVGALTKTGDASALSPLIDALKDRDSKVRQKAVEALRQIADVRVVKPLIGAPKDKDSEVRRKAVEALGQIADIRSVKPLIGALKDNDSEVRQKAVEALGPIADARSMKPLIGALKDRDSRVRGNAATALAKLGPTAAGPLVGLLKDGSKDAEAALVQLGPVAVESLIGALRHGDFNVRYSAAQSLSEIGDPRAVEPLIALLKSDRWAAGPLGRCGDARALQPLVMAIKRVEGRGPFDNAQQSTPAAEWAKEVEPALKRLLDRVAGSALPEHLRLVGSLNDFYTQEYANGYLRVDCTHVKDMARRELTRRGVRA